MPDYLNSEMFLTMHSPIRSTKKVSKDITFSKIYDYHCIVFFQEGNEEVLLALEEAGGLLAKEAYQHKYPYDWRTKKPTIFRATDQWFASVDRFRTAALGSIDEVIIWALRKCRSMLRWLCMEGLSIWVGNFTHT